MRVSIIVAAAANGVIGRDNALPWRLPADLKRFKALTMGHTLILGRKTWESIGRPLPGRSMVVVTRQEGYAPPGVRVVRSLDEALEAAEAEGEDEVFIAGGAEIYRQVLPRTGRIYLTRIEEEFAGDTYLPALEPAQWRIVAEEHHEPDGDNPHPYTFQVLERA